MFGLGKKEEAPKIFTKDIDGNKIFVGDEIEVHFAHSDKITHLDAYPTAMKKQILNGKPKKIVEIAMSGNAGIVYIQEGTDRVHFVADTIVKYGKPKQ